MASRVGRLRLFNSIGRRVEPLAAQDPDHLRMYVCGPTVCSYAHIGNARPAVVFDLLVRHLRAQFPRVTYARNITDMDDTIIAASSVEGGSCDAISARFTAGYHTDLAALGAAPRNLPFTHRCRPALRHHRKPSCRRNTRSMRGLRHRCCDAGIRS